MIEDIIKAIRQKRIAYRMKNLPEQPLRVVLSPEGYWVARACASTFRYVRLQGMGDDFDTIYGVPFTTDPDQKEPFRLVEG